MPHRRLPICLRRLAALAPLLLRVQRKRTPIALAILLALIDLGAASALVRTLRRGARRPSGSGKRGAASVEVTAAAAAEGEKAADSVGSPSSNNEGGGGHDETAGGGGATVDLQDEEAASGAMPSARKFV